MLRDRMVRGMVAGFVAGIAMNIIDLALYYLGISKLRYLDWAAFIIYYTKPVNLVEAIFAQFAQLIFITFLGAVFAYLILFIKSQNILLRGLTFGLATWFLLYAISMLFKMEQTIPLRFGTAFSDFISSAVYGLVLAKTLSYLDKRVKDPA